LPVRPGTGAVMRLLYRLRTQLILSHLIAIACTLVAMVAALVLIAGSWYAGQQGSLSEPTQQARIIAGAVGGLAGKEPAAPELNAVLRAVARGELQLLVAPSSSALDVAQRMAQTTLHDIAYIVIIGSSGQPLESS